MRVVYSVDVEQDYGGRLDSYKGVLEGLPVLLDLFKQYGVKTTFFVTGDVLMKHTQQLLEIKKAGHEIAFHSKDHVNLKDEIVDELEYQTRINPLLRDKFDIKGFRAPYCASSNMLCRALQFSEYLYDSSVVGGSLFPGRYNYLFAPTQPYHQSITDFRKKAGTGLLEIPISTIPVLRLPLALSFLKKKYGFFKRFLRYDQDVVMMYSHAHEFVKGIDAPKRFGSNKTSLNIMEDLICEVFDKRKAVRAEDVL